MMPHEHKPENGGTRGGAGRRVSVVDHGHGTKLGTVSSVYIPVFLNIMSILMFLRFGLILGQVGFLGILGQLENPWNFKQHV